MDAVLLTLQSSDGVAASKQQVAASEGALLSTRAPFDTVWTAGASQQQSVRPQIAAAGGGDFVSRQSGYSAGVSRRLESGTVVNPAITINRTRDDASNATAPSYSNVALNFVIPLLKGGGKQVNTAPTAAAALGVDAARDSYRHALSASVSRTVATYWDWVAARQALELADQARQRTAESLEIAKKLAAADEIPKADLLKYDVRRVVQEAVQERSAQQVRTAALALAQAMNVPLTAVTTPKPASSVDTFPQAQSARLALLGDNAALTQLVASSAEQRYDLRAAEHRLRAAQQLAQAASTDSSKQLDLNVSVGYTGLAEGRSALGAFSALGYPGRGANIGVTLNYTVPAGNLDKQGLVAQRGAAAELARIELDTLRLRIAGDVTTQLDALRTAVGQLEKAREQRRLQSIIYENEKRAYQASLSTLLELFTVESQLNAYQTEWVDAQRNFAQALVLFRFQTGRLLPGSASSGSIRGISLTALPEPFELVDSPDRPTSK